MLVTGLDAVKYEWKVKGDEIHHTKKVKSALHKKARDLILKKFPTSRVIEEVAMKPTKNSKYTLFFDFYFPLQKVAVEVQGQQHFSFNSMYHASRMDFMKQLKRDSEKEEWCDINGIKLIKLSYNNVDTWEDML